MFPTFVEFFDRQHNYTTKNGFLPTVMPIPNIVLLNVMPTDFHGVKLSLFIQISELDFI